MGLYPMSGNVREWVADWWDENYYLRASSRRENRNPKGPTTGTLRVARGGGWIDLNPKSLTTTARDPMKPATRFPWVGFRCALDLNAKARKLR